MIRCQSCICLLFKIVAFKATTNLIFQGGETENSPSSADVKIYDLEKSEWTAQPDMLVKRKDHACALVTLGEEKGILVSGGVNEDDQLLDSVEFFSIDKDEWKEVAHLKQARTEHGKNSFLLFLHLVVAFIVFSESFEMFLMISITTVCFQH